MPTYSEIRYEAADHVATCTWHRPEQRNALTPSMLGETMAAVREAQDDAAVRVLVITGAGRAFCAGGDTKAMARVVSTGSPDSLAGERLGQIQELQLLLRRFPKVVIAAVNGAAYGAGLDLACTADSRLAADLTSAPREFAQRFVLSAPRSVQIAKRTLYRGLEMSFEASLDFIRPHIAALRQTEDHKEGLRALQERRLPRFEGR